MHSLQVLPFLLTSEKRKIIGMSTFKHTTFIYIGTLINRSTDSGIPDWKAEFVVIFKWSQHHGFRPLPS